MKFIILLFTCTLSIAIFSQTIIKGPWALECGVSTNNGFKKSSSLNLRYVSPRFKWSENEMTEGDEKHVENFKNMRLMIEIIYNPPFNVLCTGFNTQYRLAKYKRFNFELYGGLKFFWIPGPDYVDIPYLKAGKELWYMNLGILCQLDFAFMAPFVDIGGDGIITIGTELNFHKIYNKPKRKYKLNTKTKD